MRPWLRQNGLPILVTCLCVLSAFATVKALGQRGDLRVPEFLVYDSLVSHRAAPPATQAADSSCVIVGIEEPDIQAWGDYPISDRVMADLLDRILQGNPAAIGLDIYRDLPKPDKHHPLDAEADQRRLEKIFTDNPQVIVSTLIGSEPRYEVLPPAVLAESRTQVGCTDVKPDEDDVLRRALLYEDNRHGAQRYSLALCLALNAMPPDTPWGFSGSGRNVSFQIGKTTFANFQPKDGPYANAGLEESKGFQLVLDYRAPREFPEFSVRDVVRGAVPPAAFTDKVVLIGTWMYGVKDFINTPLKNNDFGVTFHARVVDQLLRAAQSSGMRSASGSPLRSWSPLAESAWLALFCMVGAAIAWGVRPPGRYFAGAIGVTMLTVATALVLCSLSVVVFEAFSANWWVPAVSPLLGFLISGGLVTIYSSVRGRLDRRAMMQLFSWCVAEDVAKEIWENRESIFTKGELTPRRMRATVLFTDLVGFSSRAERRDPRETMAWLKVYFESIAGLVQEERGNINKFNGDQIVAVFGPPFKHNAEQAADDARHAVRCALKMRQKLVAMNLQWKLEGRDEVRMRVGIHSGHVVAGSLGTRGRLEWTVVGSDVNIAARLESTHKSRMDPDIAAGGCRILISNRTRRHLDASVNVRRFGRLLLKGLQRRVLVYGVCEPADPRSLENTDEMPPETARVPNSITDPSAREGHKETENSCEAESK